MPTGLFHSSCNCASASPTPRLLTADADPARVLLHPELTDRPAAIRWVITSYPFDLSVAASHPNSPLSQLVAKDLLVEVTGESGSVVTEAACPEDWRDIAGEVRRAVEDTVSALQSGDTEDEGTADTHLDAALVDIAPQVLDRYVRPLAGAHGGKIEITRISAGTVWVDLEGACRGCPAARFTLQQRFERELDRRVPGARVREAR